MPISKGKSAADAVCPPATWELTFFSTVMSMSSAREDGRFEGNVGELMSLPVDAVAVVEGGGAPGVNSTGSGATIAFATSGAIKKRTGLYEM
jgi:hypothetical protein